MDITSFKSLFQKKRYGIKRIYGGDKTFYIILAISMPVSALLFIFGFLTMIGTTKLPIPFLSGFDLIIFAALGSIGPVGFYNYLKIKRKKEVGDKLPDFLRDVANSTSSGMTIYDAMHSAAKGDYGHLTKELKIMSSQLSWGIPTKDALTNFAERMNTDELRRLAITINKALEIGGNTSSVFNAAAKEIDQIKRVERQRKTEMSMYSMVIFISLFVFIAVILIIDKTIFAAIFDMQVKMEGSNIAGGSGGLQLAKVDPDALKNLFYTFIFVQSMGGGMLGGYMTDGNLSSGIRYSFALIIISFFIFKFLF